MRFFVIACVFGIVVASLGCMTKNWSSPLFGESEKSGQQDEPPFARKSAMSEQLFGSGVDPRARDIERRLGFQHKE
ncbi:MAG: hypothetical protein ACR2NP_09080 [Pirellulaceae bacterium]